MFLLVFTRSCVCVSPNAHGFIKSVGTYLLFIVLIPLPKKNLLDNAKIQNLKGNKRSRGSAPSIHPWQYTNKNSEILLFTQSSNASSNCQSRIKRITLALRRSKHNLHSAKYVLLASTLMGRILNRPRIKGNSEVQIEIMVMYVVKMKWGSNVFTSLCFPSHDWIFLCNPRKKLPKQAFTVYCLEIIPISNLYLLLFFYYTFGNERISKKLKKNFLTGWNKMLASKV